MSQKRLFLIGFFALLVVGFFAAMSMAIPNFTNPTRPPIGEVKPFRFTNQDGQPVTEAAVKGKVTAIEYFFTTCRGICPRMNNNLRTIIYDAYKDEPAFQILSHTCDPETDSVAQIKRYADSLGVNTKQWVFLTGRKDSLYDMARHAYKIDDPKNNLTSIEDDFLHTQFIALLNKKGQVVKIYDALKPSELKDMKKEVAKLLKE